MERKHRTQHWFKRRENNRINAIKHGITVYLLIFNDDYNILFINTEFFIVSNNANGESHFHILSTAIIWCSFWLKEIRRKWMNAYKCFDWIESNSFFLYIANRHHLTSFCKTMNLFWMFSIRVERTFYLHFLVR